jgi:hypothetical protein
MIPRRCLSWHIKTSIKKSFVEVYGHWFYGVCFSLFTVDIRDGRSGSLLCLDVLWEHRSVHSRAVLSTKSRETSPLQRRNGLRTFNLGASRCTYQYCCRAVPPIPTFPVTATIATEQHLTNVQPLKTSDPQWSHVGRFNSKQGSAAVGSANLWELPVCLREMRKLSYVSDLLIPLIEEHHKPTYRARLQRHQNKSQSCSVYDNSIRKECLIFCIRVAYSESLAGFQFALVSIELPRRNVNLFRNCSWKNSSTGSNTGKYVSIMEMSNFADDLIQRQILFPDRLCHCPLDSLGDGQMREESIAMTGACARQCMIWCNARPLLDCEHTQRGGDVQECL